VIVVTGADGQLGSAFRTILTTGATFLTREDLDIVDVGRIAPTLQAAEPLAIINCAAYTDVDRAESQPDLARSANVDAVGKMAEVAGEIGASFVTFSSDYVFDGRKNGSYVESDEPAPLNVYGQTKFDGERLAMEVNPESLVIRTSWLLSGTHRSFLSAIMSGLMAGSVRVVDDQYGRPTLVDDLAPAVIAAMTAGVAGVLHMTNSGEASRYSLAREIASFAGLDPSGVVPCASSENPAAALRPANSVLDSERIGESGVEPLPPYSEALAAAVAEWLTNVE
jgi:dTDP-4-dehydrorhamnose reductase